MSKKGRPKRDGSGRGIRANMGRGGCKTPQEVGKGSNTRRGRGRRRRRL